MVSGSRRFTEGLRIKKVFQKKLPIMLHQRMESAGEHLLVVPRYACSTASDTGLICKSLPMAYMIGFILRSVRKSDRTRLGDRMQPSTPSTIGPSVASYIFRFAAL